MHSTYVFSSMASVYTWELHLYKVKGPDSSYQSKANWRCAQNEAHYYHLTLLSHMILDCFCQKEEEVEMIW